MRFRIFLLATGFAFNCTGTPESGSGPKSEPEVGGKIHQEKKLNRLQPHSSKKSGTGQTGDGNKKGQLPRIKKSGIHPYTKPGVRYTRTGVKCGSLWRDLQSEYMRKMRDLRKAPASRRASTSDLRNTLRKSINATKELRAADCENRGRASLRKLRFRKAFGQYEKGLSFVRTMSPSRRRRILIRRLKKKAKHTQYARRNHYRTEARKAMALADDFKKRGLIDKARSALARALAYIRNLAVWEPNLIKAYNRKAVTLNVVLLRYNRIDFRREKLLRQKKTCEEKGKPWKWFGTGCVLTAFTNSIEMDFIFIASGSFLMGSKKGGADERPIHQVKVTRSVYMSSQEVTIRQWRLVMGKHPHAKGDLERKDDDRPIVNISWYDAQKFIKKLNSMEGHKSYRLPTEAEWEYAARAGTKSRWSFGNDASKLSEFSWFIENSGTTVRRGRKFPHFVGRKKTNLWGLYDMYGNVREWCYDRYGAGYYRWSLKRDPSGPSSGMHRVVRGGSFLDQSAGVRSAKRDRLLPQARDRSTGFRLVSKSLRL